MLYYDGYNTVLKLMILSTKNRASRLAPIAMESPQLQLGF